MPFANMDAQHRPLTQDDHRTSDGEHQMKKEDMEQEGLISELAEESLEELQAHASRLGLPDWQHQNKDELIQRISEVSSQSF